ncbi:unnamed protein product (macronuclear) [Paramecium tetraurelia]|uniref:RAP domain-containing protein n=1 Tax=Paramecium tetraurelia TaxID=5888 RepID=A0DLM7_PARTE|nr:uncharacterized protein GSPATT00039576001 [Paramecium tetraurelia]CAK83944.1 unnamed protein product [Paramecium tetraurelia]|eukprot:XP_001451341.1 hypothetical protein (macronuclear) [Paramecium tetraurelia strain d4-2]
MRLNILKESFSTFLKSGDKSYFKYGLVDCKLKDISFQFKTPQFKDIAQQYYEAYEKKGDEYEKLNEELQQWIRPEYLQDVSQIMNHFNMLDLSAWQNLVVQICNSLETIPLQEMSITLKQIFLFMNRKFRMQESTVEQYHYSEYDLPLVFTEKQLFTILNQMKFDQTQVNDYLDALTTLLNIFFKFSRIQPISFYDVYEVVRNKLQIVLDKHLNELDLNNSITLYQSYGSEPKIIQQIIHKVQQLDSVIPHRELDRILEIWKTKGSIDQDLLLILKSEILYQINLTNKYQQNKVFQRIFALIYANVNDAEILNVIEKKLLKSTQLLETRNYSFQNGYLTCIKILKLRHPELTLPDIKMKPKSVSKQMQKSLQENILINFFRQYVKSLSEKVKIQVDAPCWIYLIDVALLFQDAKIAFELSGSVYFRGNNLTGKKQAKKEIMISEGWKPIFLGNQEKILFNNFSFNQQQLPEQIEKLFDELFEKALGRKVQKKQD